MDPEFRITRLSLVLLIAISAHTGWSGIEQEIVAGRLSEHQEALVTHESVMKQWQTTRNELELVYLAHPHLNPLEQQTLLEYSWQARAHIETLSESVQAVAYLLRSAKSEPRQFDLAVQTLRNNVRSYSLNRNN